MKTHERRLARALRRKEGASIKEIARRVGVSVSSVSLWVRDIDLRFLRTYFDLAPQDIRITCHLFADHIERQREIERHWLDLLELPPESLRKSVVNVHSRHSKRKRLNMLPYGTCRVVVSRTAVTQHIFGAIQEYAGFRRDAWLE